MSIRVRTIDDTNFEVTVEERATTTHRVAVPYDYYQELTAGSVTPEILVERSFKFLLEREPNTSILRQFELSVIQTYFPEYEKAIKSMLQ